MRFQRIKTFRAAIRATCASLLLFASAGRAHGAEFPASDIEFFETRVRPILVESCYKCHSATAKKLKGGLLLDSREAVLKGGESGLAIVPGHPEKSRLITALEYEDVDLQMPPKGRLTEAQISDFSKWIKTGAPWPESKPGSQTVKNVKKFDLQARKKNHWAWSDLQLTQPPEIPGQPIENPIDRFVLAKLEAAGIKPAQPAEKRTLLRRATFDLAGLPPTPEEVADFLQDTSPNAFSKVIDRLLDSPRFGERWGRHWLDLVRYAETYGHEFDYPILGAWQYRDYVIRAFNSNLPYNQFLLEQMAGDLIEKPRLRNGINESVLGTIYFCLGQQVHSPVELRVHELDRIDNEIDVASKAFLGLTVSCARCHDHKFDAIATRDYYSMFSVLASSRYAQRSIVPPNNQLIQNLAEKKGELRSALAGDWIASLATVGEADLAKINPLAQPEVFGGTNTTLFASAETCAFSGWLADGPAFQTGLVKRGGLLIRGQGKLALSSDIVINSGAISSRLQGAFRSPDFTITNKYLYVRCAGQNVRMNLVIDGFTMIRDPIYGGLRHQIGRDELGWTRFDVAMWPGQTAYLELADTEPGDLADDGRRYGKEGWLSIERVISSDSPEPPGISAGRPESAPSRTELTDSLARWGKGTESKMDVDVVLAFFKAQKPEPRSEKAIRLLADFQALENSLPEQVYVASVTDGPGLDEHIFIRGNYKTLGERAPRAFLTALRSNDEHVDRGSGRLEIAREMLETPLASRVRVNWIWHHLFGRGLVPTVDNFGVMGEKPSHPELLDWLANDFRTHGWDIKRTIRLILASRTYQMSSRDSNPDAEQRDPSNALLHRANVRRLEGEAIRDNILAVSGALRTNMFGPSVPIYLTPFMDGRGRPGQSGPMDGDGRRSIYVELRRNFLSPMLLAFDAPIPYGPVGRRTSSNVPAQALIMLNDPFVAQEADLWAGRIMSCASADERIQHMYEAAFARPPHPEELEQAHQFLDKQAAAYDLKPEETMANHRLWADLCQVLFNVKEFIFID